MHKAWPLWLLVSLCLLAGLCGMLWLSIAVLRLSRTEAEARRQAPIEESVRLALWRMDSTLSPIIAQETARPYFDYRAFVPAGRAYPRMFNDDRGEMLIPSPLLGQDVPLIDLYFQIDPTGALTSPQAPAADELKLGKPNAKLRSKIASASKRLDRVKAIVSRDALLAQLPPNQPHIAPPIQFPNPQAQIAGNNDPQPMPNGPPAYAQQQTIRNAQEYSARQNSSANSANYELLANRLDPKSAGGDVREGFMKPLWMRGQLLLARRVTIDGQDYVQACWMNWPAVQQSLLSTVSDLLPAASIEPAENAEPEKQSRLLASIPATLIPGAVPIIDQAPTVPVKMILSVAWAGVLLASAALASLVWGAMRLSARRAAFVSAVTHELRTPLTTVSMYAEMLEGGMVAEPSRREYLSTLRCEAERLGHLVENVLAYSRIERGGLGGRIQSVQLPRLLEATRQRLDSRAAQAGMQLSVHVSPQAADATVRADASAVEQILFNLVDNACKYANGGEKLIEISAERDGRFASISVRDHGPGISPEDARKLFRPFSKSARDAAGSVPGVGLGLALSRRLARQMSGDLKLEQPDSNGAYFVLTLPTQVLAAD